jgi:hypothetical protein
MAAAIVSQQRAGAVSDDLSVPPERLALIQALLPPIGRRVDGSTQTGWPLRLIYWSGGHGLSWG